MADATDQLLLGAIDGVVGLLHLVRVVLADGQPVRDTHGLAQHYPCLRRAYLRHAAKRAIHFVVVEINHQPAAEDDVKGLANAQRLKRVVIRGRNSETNPRPGRVSLACILDQSGTEIDAVVVRHRACELVGPTACPAADVQHPLVPSQPEKRADAGLFCRVPPFGEIWMLVLVKNRLECTDLRKLASPLLEEALDAAALYPGLRPLGALAEDPHARAPPTASFPDVLVRPTSITRSHIA